MMGLRSPSGEKLFETIQFSLVCDECLKSDHPEKCTHKSDDIPRWISASKVEIVKRLLEDDPAMLLRETMGISTESAARAFKAEAVAALLSQKRVAPRQIDTVYVAIDPASGGNSYFSIVSIAQFSAGFEVFLIVAHFFRFRILGDVHRLFSEIKEQLVHSESSTLHQKTFWLQLTHQR